MGLNFHGNSAFFINGRHKKSLFLAYTFTDSVGCKLELTLSVGWYCYIVSLHCCCKYSCAWSPTTEKLWQIPMNIMSSHTPLKLYFRRSHRHPSSYSLLAHTVSLSHLSRTQICKRSHDAKVTATSTMTFLQEKQFLSQIPTSFPFIAFGYILHWYCVLQQNKILHSHLMQIFLPFCSPSSLLTLFTPLTTLCPELISVHVMC